MLSVRNLCSLCLVLVPKDEYDITPPNMIRCECDYLSLNFFFPSSFIWFAPIVCQDLDVSFNEEIVPTDDWVMDMRKEQPDSLNSHHVLSSGKGYLGNGHENERIFQHCQHNLTFFSVVVWLGNSRLIC